MTLSRLLDNNHSSKFKQYLSGACGLHVATLLVLASLAVPSHAVADDSDGDGLTDTYELKIGSESYLSDTDGDKVKDGDEIGDNPDSPRDSDNDGVIDVLDYDDDNDGLPTYLESKKDSDKDGILDYLDKDSDNDGIADGEESGYLNQDKNRDGIDDAFDINREGAVDNNGDGIDDNIKLPDHNNDGKPDYLDGKYQHVKRILVKKEATKSKAVVAKKAVEKAVQKAKKERLVEKKETVKPKKVELVEKKEIAKPKKEIAAKLKKPKTIQPDAMIVNRHTDSDNDGLSNDLEKILGTNHLSRDSDNDKVSDAIEIGLDINSPQDSDRDGIIDALDEDDDNDGILTRLEDLNNDSTAINDDTDADGVPNYLDANDDGDGIPTKDEGYVLDTDGDGILNYLDANDAVKGTANSSNQIAKSKEIKAPAEPEVVVLFDGNAADVTEEDEMALEDGEEGTIQDSILSSLNKGLESEKSEPVVEEPSVEIKTTTSSTKPANPWNLF